MTPPITHTKIYTIILIVLAAGVCGCANEPTKQFELSKSNSWNLTDAPALSRIIPHPIDDISKLTTKVIEEQYRQKTRGKFESEDTFRARTSATPTPSIAFIAIDLPTYQCTKYNFENNTYNISCAGFRPEKLISSKQKSTGKTTLANAFSSREITYIENDEYYVSARSDAIGSIKITPDEAQKVDGDLMIGIIVEIEGVETKYTGCGKLQIELDDKICKDASFKSGSAIRTSKHTINPESIMELVVFTKSTQKVLIHKSFKPKQS